MALSPAVYFGTEHSGFQNNAYSGLSRVGVNSPFDKFSIRNIKLINVPPNFLRGPSLPFPELHFMYQIQFSSKNKSIVYDSSNRKIWIVSELSLALQMVHIWAAHEDDRVTLLSKLPYAVPSTYGVSSALEAVVESRQAVLRDVSSGSLLLFRDLVQPILERLETIHDAAHIPSEEAQNAVGAGKPGVLIGWELMDIALQVDQIFPKNVRFDKETEKQINRWKEEHPFALIFVGSNLEPHPPANPDPLHPGVPVDSKETPSFTVGAEGTESKGNNGGNQSPEFNSSPVDLDTEITSLASDSSSNASEGASSVLRTVTGATSVAQLSVVSTEPAIWQLRRLLLYNGAFIYLLTTSVEKRGIGPSRNSLRLSLKDFGRDLAKEAKTKEQTQAGAIVRLQAKTVSEMIVEPFTALIQYKSNAEQQDRRKVTAPDDTALQGRSVPETAEEDAVDSDEECTAEQRDDELSSLENFKVYILQSTAWVTLQNRLATRFATVNQYKDSGKQLEVPQPENLAPDIPEVKRKGLERQAEDQPNSRPKALVSPDLKGLDEYKPKLLTRGTEIGDEVNDGPVHPPQPVPRGPATGILLATRHTGGHLMTPESVVPPKLDDKEWKAQPRQPQHAYKDDGRMSHPLRPIPKGFIQRLDGGQFRVKTRNRCNDVFEDIISASTEEEATAFFRRVDRYDPLRGPIRKLNDKLLDFYWNFVPPTQPGPMMISSPEEGTSTLDALEQASSGKAPHEQAPLENVPPERPVPEKADPDNGLLEPASSAVAVVEEEAGADDGHDSGGARDSPAVEEKAATAPSIQQNIATAPVAPAPNAVANPGVGAAPPPPANQHKVFICLALGRPGGWRLYHAEFTGQGNEPSQVTDEAIFRQVRTEMGRFLRSRGYIRFVFPLCLSRVEYYEFALYSHGTNAVGLDSPHGVQGKLPSDHPPPPEDWRQRCPADKWYFTAPRNNTKEAEDIRDSLATATLTDAVRHRAEFSHNPGSTQYRKSVPWRLRHELTTNTADYCPRGWGFVLRFEFDIVFFLCIWGTLAIVLSLGLLGLYVGPSSPAYDQPGAAVAIFMAPIGIVGTCFGIASAYAKQKKYLD